MPREPEMMIEALNLSTKQRHSVWIGSKKEVNKEFDRLVEALDEFYKDFEIKEVRHV